MPASIVPHHLTGPILIIDDEPYIQRSLSYLLTREGYQVETTTNGEDGLSRARALRPPLVFLDLMMPRMNGYQLCAEMRRDPALSDTYIIMLTAKGQPSDREQGLQSGANEYMTKPFSPREVAQRVRAVLRDIGPVEGTETHPRPNLPSGPTLTAGPLMQLGRERPKY